ncbi:unnamed protein product [Cylindrotheca closterium]|uniref:Uncharacterized protein n=1 Tax=Cylindrotheca closterium TaxID=2856 RepID=A0AAD2FJ53_9STRA|nr:unnamed protein product [Cylindrotheca closterium]
MEESAPENNASGIEDETQNPAPSRNLVKSALFALAFWAAIFMMFVGYFAASNLQTRSYYQNQNMDGKKTKRRAKKAYKVSPQSSKLLKHHEALEDLLEAMEDLESSQAAEMEVLKDKMALVQDLQEKIGASVFHSHENVGNGVAPQATHIKKILGTQSISSLSDVETDVGMAIQELEAIIESIAAATDESSHIDLAVLDELLKQEFPERSPSVNNVKCGTKKTTEPKAYVPDDAARKSHLEDMVTILYELLDQRSKEEGKFYPMDGKTLQTSSLQTIRRWLNSKTKSVTSEIVKVAEGTADKDSNADGSCLDEEMVLDLLEGALDGMSQNIDLRNYLRRRAMELDPSAKSIILDADLPEIRPFVPEPKTLQLSRVLDKPILFEVVDWIDKLVEAVGGYNDSVDNYLDSVAGSSRASIGELVMEEVLKKADGVEIPNPKPTIEKVVKRILKKQ